MIEYLRPSALPEALSLLSPERTIVAGATDVYPVRTSRQAWGQPTRDRWLDISAIPDLRGITRVGDFWRIGALTTWTDIATEKTFPPAFDGLRAAARDVGGVQIQNRATVGGNLCNASPAADGVPPLLCLDASVELQSVRGIRTLPLANFIQGSRQTACESDELVSAILVPANLEGARGVFVKLGARRYLVISIVMVSIVVTLDGQEVTQSSVAVGSCSAVAQRLTSLEQSMKGKTLDEALSLTNNPGFFQELLPIDDIRATAEYRSAVARELTRRSIQQLITVDGPLDE